MNVVRILQIIALLLLLTYFVLLHAANPVMVDLPFLLPMPPALALGIALLIGWLLGWVPGRISAWRKAREVRRLESRVSELEQHLPSYDKEPERDTPVIPDRMPRAQDGASDRHSG